MNENPRATEFVVFCIENTAKRLKKSGKEVYAALKASDGIKKFLYPSFEVLHSQGKEYIVDEVLQYLKMKNPNFLGGSL